MIAKEKARIFAKAYVRNKFNATKTIKELEPDISSPGYAQLKAHRMIRRERVQQALREVLAETGLDSVAIAMLLKRNAGQSKSIQGSNQALDMAIKVRGEYAPEKTASINLIADITTDQQATELIQRLLKEAKELELPENMSQN